MSNIQRLLVPIDGSDLADRSIAASVSLAAQLGAAIVGFIVEVGQKGPAARRLMGFLDDEATDNEALTEERARVLLARFEAAASAAGVSFEGVFERLPQIDKAIVAAAESHGCDLIVMATHGRGAFGEFLFGSQTKAVLASCRLPLLVLQ